MIEYNSQRDNHTFRGKFRAWWQCFATSSWMFLSWYVPEIKGSDDRGLAQYLDNTEDSIGKRGLGEKIKKKFNWITGHTTYWWLVHKYAIEAYMWRGGVKGTCIFQDYDITFEQMNMLLESGPVIFQTKKMGGLKGGHIILILEYVGGSYIVMDPFGDATTHYQDSDGGYKKYPDWFLKKYCGNKYGKVRCLWWEK